jgi:protein ImuB
MRRVVSVFLPTYATDRVRRKNISAPPRDRPLVTVAQDGNRRILVAVDTAARALRLRPGMTVAHAQSLIPDLMLIDAVPDDDEAALVQLGHWCSRYSPLVTPDPPNGLFIDIAGAAHLFKGEAGLLDDLSSRFKAAQFEIRVAVADTPGCAWASARFGQGGIVPPGRRSDVLGPLPVAALRLPAHTIESLADVGIERIAQLAAKPRSALRTRFGGDLLLRFDQALGATDEALTSLQPVEVPSVSMPFVEPISTPEDLERVIDRLCALLTKELELKGIGARRLDLVFLRVDNVCQAVRIGTARPTRDARHLGKLLRERLVLVDPGFGVERAMLTASWVEALTERQTLGRHVGGEETEADIGMLVDTLRTRLGPDRVFRLAPVESEIPERAVKRIPPAAPATGVSWPNDLPRPARLLSPPESVKVIAQLPDSPPAQFSWRDQTRRIVKADGPERIPGEWWVSDRDVGLVRDYYRIECVSGERFWLFRDAPAEEGGRWWLHGIGEA